MNLPIADYADFVEVTKKLAQRVDQQKYARDNFMLLKARRLADKYHAEGKHDIATRILKVASDTFLQNRCVEAFIQEGLV